MRGGARCAGGGGGRSFFVLSMDVGWNLNCQIVLDCFKIQNHCILVLRTVTGAGVGTWEVTAYCVLCRSSCVLCLCDIDDDFDFEVIFDLFSHSAALSRAFLSSTSPRIRRVPS